MHFTGRKTIDIYENLIKDNLPSNLGDFLYVEPFGGTFNIGNIIKPSVNRAIYNDINIYPWVSKIVKADEIYHLDYMEIIDKFDSIDTLFYLDPPYFKKEHVYGIEHDRQMHIDLCNKLKTIQGKFILSYESHMDILKLYNGFKVQYYDGTLRKYSNEMVICN